FPGTSNDTCPQCRKKLKYDVIDTHTPMKPKYVIAFSLLVILYLAMVGLSVYCTMLMIPGDSMYIWLYIAIIANLSILWPLLIVFIVTVGIDCCCGPRDRTGPGWMGSGCYCSGDCGAGECGGEDCGCGDCGGDCDCCGGGGGGGDECGLGICVFCLFIIVAILIAATGYLVMSLYKYYKSFSLSSKMKIVFKEEGRKLDTLAGRRVARKISKQDPKSRGPQIV
ncbi:unnamed protein product, partial [Meganyctiphanes norvegica]